MYRARIIPAAIRTVPDTGIVPVMPDRRSSMSLQTISPLNTITSSKMKIWTDPQNVFSTSMVVG